MKISCGIRGILTVVHENPFLTIQLQAHWLVWWLSLCPVFKAATAPRMVILLSERVIEKIQSRLQQWSVLSIWSPCYNFSAEALAGTPYRSIHLFLGIISKNVWKTGPAGLESGRHSKYQRRLSRTKVQLSQQTLHLKNIVVVLQTRNVFLHTYVPYWSTTVLLDCK